MKAIRDESLWHTAHILEQRSGVSTDPTLRFSSASEPLCGSQDTEMTFSSSCFLFFLSRQAQVLAMAGHAKEAEKMTLRIISKSNSCIECYRLLSAIYSKQGNYTEVCVCVGGGKRNLYIVYASKLNHFVLIKKHLASIYSHTAVTVDAVIRFQGRLLSPKRES